MGHEQNIVTAVTVQASMQGAAGWVMWFLVLLSIATLVVIVERYLFLTMNRGDISAVQVALNRLMASGKVEDAKELLKGEKGMAAKVVGEGLEAIGRGRYATEEIMIGVAKAERLRYDRGLGFLGTLGNNAPFIGLFGTVLEIIRSLHILSEKSGVGAGAVMSSLSEALAATAIGLLVALPAVAAHNYFRGRIRVFTTEADALGNVLLAYVGETEAKAARGTGTPPAPAAPTGQARGPAPAPAGG